ncbi:MAG: glycosyltransferase [Muribaculaceae bacterium]|nr:glycosyltransferase [Muribaculaceae bacterium]
MNESPLFSIVTITYNAGATVGRTLESIARQDFRDYEHIVVDGASCDATLQIVDAAAGSDHRRVISEPDEGLYDAMNKGLKAAKGDYLIFLNAGDKFHSHDTLSAIARTIREYGRPGVVYGQTVLVDDEGRFIGPRHLSAPACLRFEDFAKGMLVCHQAFVARRDITPEYNTHWRFSADYEWCLRCLAASESNVDTGEVLIDYLSEGLTTANRRKSLIERYKIMCKYYGTIPTTLRHLGFALRFLKNKK